MIKAPTNKFSIKEVSLEGNNLESSDDEESANSNEDRMLFQSKSTKSEGNGILIWWSNRR